MPKVMPRRSSRNAGKVIDYNQQEKMLKEQIKEIARLDKKRYYREWREMEKKELREIKEYHKFLLSPDPEPETESESETESEDEPEPEKKLSDYHWKDNYETITDLYKDIQVLYLKDSKYGQTIDMCLNNETDFHMAFLSYYVKINMEILKLK